MSYFNGDGTLSWWYLQKDVLLFQCQNGEEYSGYLDTFVVEDMNYYYEEASQFNELLLNSNSTLADLIALKDSIIASGQLRMFAPVLTRFPYDANIQQKYYRTDDQLLITFHDPTIDSITIANFANEYQLKLVYKPSASTYNSITWAHVFKLNAKPDTILNTIIMANIIATYEPSLVKYATPNIIGGESLACTEYAEMINYGTNNYSWHIRNQGEITFNGNVGTIDADADICECWGEGFTGDGIRVGIIDEGAVKSNHPDLYGFDEGWNAISDVAIPANTNHNMLSNNPHLMKVSGIVGAIPGNNGAVTRSIGAAFGASLHPYLISLSSQISTVSVAKATERVFLDGIDVVNMSFRLPFDPQISNHISNGFNFGRPDGLGGFLGIIYVAGTGNNDLQVSNFPANHPQVIGVGMSNPSDYRSANSSPIAWVGQSTYGPPSFNYDVVAPGELIRTTSISGGGGGSAENFEEIDFGTSYSSPLVASIAAILLEKNPNLSAIQIRDLIRNGADKVHPAYYNYNQYPNVPGYNDEMFYGRVSCINSLNQVLSVHENELQKLTLMRIDQNTYKLILPELNSTSELEIYSTTGQLVRIEKINVDQFEVTIPLEEYSNGMYFVKLLQNKQAIGVSKLVK